MPRQSARLSMKARRDYRKMAGLRPVAKRVKNTLVKKVTAIINRKIETKYVAEQIQLAGYTIPGSITPDVDYHPMLPQVAQQTGQATSNVREGDSIEPIRANIRGHIWYDNLDTVVGNVVFVKLFFVTAKSVKLTTNFATDLPSGLLEEGGADPVPWVAAKQDLQAFYPVCKENYTVLKTMTFKLVKNGGLPIGNQPGHDTNIGRDRYSFSYSWTPPKLKYGNDNDTYPQNHAPLMLAVAYSPGYNYTTDSSLVGQVKMNWQVDMSYKDA